MNNIEKEKPFDLLNGLSPTVAVEQRTALYVNPRSTVGTKTMIYTLLRQLYTLESTKAGSLEFKHFTFSIRNLKALFHIFGECWLKLPAHTELIR